jgi:hypothetical protein
MSSECSDKLLSEPAFGIAIRPSMRAALFSFDCVFDGVDRLDHKQESTNLIDQRSSSMYQSVAHPVSACKSS